MLDKGSVKRNDVLFLACLVMVTMWKLLRSLGKFPKRMDYSQRIVSIDAPERLYFKVSSLQDKNT